MLQTAIPYAAHATLKVGGVACDPPLRSLAKNNRGKGLSNHIHKHARPARRQLALWQGSFAKWRCFRCRRELPAWRRRNPLAAELFEVVPDGIGHAAVVGGGGDAVAGVVLDEFLLVCFHVSTLAQHDRRALRYVNRLLASWPAA